MRATCGALLLIVLTLFALDDRALSESNGAQENGYTITDFFDGARSVFAADLDSDGDMDVLGAARYAGDIVWWENVYGAGSRWITHLVEDDFPGAMSVYAADLDSDGDQDILGASWDSDEVSWWSNDGSGAGWNRHLVDDELLGSTAVYAADLDSDGDTDILGAGLLGAEVVWWENVYGTGLSWTRHLVDCYSEGVSSIQAADVDSDGDLDLITAASKLNAVIWWENVNGDGRDWTRHPVDSSFGQARCAFAADVDGDGDLDILGASAGEDEIAWWENADGDGRTWNRRVIERNFKTTCAVYAADLDSDGDTDVLGVSTMGNTVRWWENVDGRGSSWYGHTVDTDFGGAYAVHAADLDGDGTMDIVAAALAGDSIRWWRTDDVSLVYITH